MLVDCRQAGAQRDAAPAAACNIRAFKNFSRILEGTGITSTTVSQTLRCHTLHWYLNNVSRRMKEDEDDLKCAGLSDYGLHYLHSLMMASTILCTNSLIERHAQAGDRSLQAPEYAAS